MQTLFDHEFSLDQILNKAQIKLKRTKMICTIGPASNNIETLEKLIKSGMTVARLNFSHGTHESHLQILNNVRQAIRNTNSLGQVGIMLDTKGPEIRTGFLENGHSVQLKEGQTLRITGDYSVKGNAQILALSYKDVVSKMKAGQKILIADGNLTLKVEQVEKEALVTTVMNDYKLGERKNVNLPGVKVDIPVITEKDRHDILNFGLKHKVDYVALSFTRTRKCIESCRNLLGAEGKGIQIIPKIENEEGLENILEIIQISDGLMMARGDLGMELEPSKLLIAQKYMTKQCRRLGKPVICATQMLESMTKNSRPTRAEMSDVGNAVLDSVDSVMLSGETGNGMFVEESAGIMRNICREVEHAFNFETYFKKYKRKIKSKYAQFLTEPSYILGESAVKLSIRLKTKAIIVLDNSGVLTRRISCFRPKAFVVNPCSDLEKLQKLNLCFGVFGIYCQPADYLEKAKDFIFEKNIAEVGEKAILVDFQKMMVRIYNL